MRNPLTLWTMTVFAAALVACGDAASTGENVGPRPVSDTPVADVGPGTTTSTPPPTSFSKHWYVSPQGNDSNDGSEAKPFKTISKAVTQVGPGEIVHVKAGTYAEQIVIGGSAKAGSGSSKITLQGEGSPKLVPAGATPLKINKPGWIVDGFDIDVKGQKHFAVEFFGDVQGSMIVNSKIHDGSHGAGVNVHTNARGALIENNVISGFDRGDDDSHGVVVQTTTHDTVVRNNDIHSNSGDSVQCLGSDGYNNNAPADGLVIENNLLHDNRENAVDIKTCNNVVIRNNDVHGFRYSSTARGEAIVVHYTAKNVVIEDNEIYDAGRGISVGGNHNGTPPAGVVVQRNRIHDIVKTGGSDGVGIRMEASTGTKVLNNTVVDTAGPGLLIGGGTGGNTANATVSNNIVKAAMAVQLGASRSGLTMRSNLYSPEAKFLVLGAVAPLSALDAEAGAQGSVVADPGFTDIKLTPGAAAVDKGAEVGLKFCGKAPDIGAVETGC